MRNARIEAFLTRLLDAQRGAPGSASRTISAAILSLTCDAA
jgi:hypothetical protein